MELYSFQENQMDKKKLREIYLKKRNTLNNNEINCFSSKIAYSIFEHEYYKTAKSIFTYINTNSEVKKQLKNSYKNI